MFINSTSSVSKAEVLNQWNEVEILSAVFPEITEVPCVICSPLRPEQHPSFSLYLTEKGSVRYKDFGCVGEQGTLFDLLCKYWGCTFKQALERICELIIDKKGISVKSKQIKTLTRKEKSQLQKLQVVVRPWRDYDYEYWKSYGIEKQWLKYAEVYPISHKIIFKKDKNTNAEHKYIFSADKYAYCFVERKEGNLQMKIYQPFNTNGFKWCSSMDGSVIGLWTKIPEYGDRVVICSSLKDALVLACQCHIPTLCLQGEGYNISNTAVKELKRRYKKVFICFDTDKPGLADAKALAEKTGFINVVPNLGKEKDLSDYYKALEDKEQFKQLEELFY